MAKQTGLGDNLYVSGYDLSGDIGALKRIGGGPAALAKTGINKSAYERLGGQRDGSMEYTAFFNKATDQAHSRFSALPSADQIATYCRGTTLGNASAAMVCKQLNYDGERDNEGDLVFEIEARANGYGIEWGRLLTAGKRTDGSAGTGTGVDFAASTSFGLQAYLHVFAFTGTSVTVKLQESSDDAASDAYADVTGGAFTAATGVTSQRIATANDLTVERYLRVVTTGTFSNAVFSVTVVKNETAVVF